jgi:hypothetical protein
LGTTPANEAVAAMWPPSPCATMRCANDSTPWITPHRSTSITQRQSSWVMSTTGPLTATPAFRNTMCTAPIFSKAESASACTDARSLTSHTMPSARAPCVRSLRTAASSAGGLDIGDDEQRALAHKRLGGREADPARAARDHRNAVA